MISISISSWGFYQSCELGHNWDTKTGQNGPILGVFPLHRILRNGFLWKPKVDILALGQVSCQRSLKILYNLLLQRENAWKQRLTLKLDFVHWPKDRLKREWHPWKHESLTIGQRTLPRQRKGAYRLRGGNPEARCRSNNASKLTQKMTENRKFAPFNRTICQQHGTTLRTEGK